MLSEFDRRKQDKKRKKKKLNFLKNFVHETDPEVDASPSFPFDSIDTEILLDGFITF